jgi:hypothetical protein
LAVRVERAGFWCLAALLVAMPFDPVQEVFVRVGRTSLTVSNAAFLALGLLAAIRVTVALRPQKGPAGERRDLGLAAFTLLAILLVAVLSSTGAGSLDRAEVWIADVAASGFVVLALPRWLELDHERRGAILARSLVAGGVAAALVGYAEFLFGSPVERLLTAYRPGPTLVGPFLRLTSVFHHANIAAMYLEICLCLAAAGFGASIQTGEGDGRAHRLLRTVLWGGAANILVLALLLTFSRGAALGILAAVAVGALALRRQWAGRFPAAGVRWVAVTGANVALLLGLFLLSTSSIEALRLTTGTDTSWYNATYSGSPPATMHAGTRSLVSVTVKNDSPLVWESRRPGEYALSYHWLYLSSRIAQFDTALAQLPSILVPGAARSVRIWVRAPVRAGAYLLIWDLLWRQSTWFDLKTGIYPRYRVSVTGVAAQPGDDPAGFSQPGDSSLVYLPVSTAQSRLTEWRVALHTFWHRPVLGGGLFAFQQEYASSVPEGPAANPPLHAHNLVLTLLDSWGIVGLALLGVLAALIWLPLLLLGLRSGTLSPFAAGLVAAGAAIFGHGLVDYFFGTPAVLLAVSVLSGLALDAGSAATSPSETQKRMNSALDPSK